MKKVVSISASLGLMTAVALMSSPAEAKPVHDPNKCAPVCGKPVHDPN